MKDKNGGRGTSGRWRALALAGLLIIMLAAALYRIAIWRLESLRTPPSPDPAIVSQIEILPDGVPLVAADGTIGHELVDWLNSTGSEDRFFEVGGKQYVGRSVIPLPTAQQRLRSLVDVLNAYPDVSVTIVGFTNSSGDTIADRNLTNDRAARLVAHLVQAGISPKRLAIDARGGRQPLVREHLDANERIGIIFHKSS